MTFQKSGRAVRMIGAVGLLAVFAFGFSCPKASAEQVVSETHAQFEFTYPSLIMYAGITFGFSGNFPKMADFVNPDFLQEVVSIKETKKTARGYDVVYEFAFGAGTYVISYKINEKERSVSFDRIRASVAGGQNVDLRCPEFLMSNSDMRELGRFYGFMKETFPVIFNVEKMNAAINDVPPISEREEQTRTFSFGEN